MLQTIQYYDMWEVRRLKPLKKSVSITLDEDVIEKIRLFAEETDRSFSQYINLLLRKHIIAREARDEAKSDEWSHPNDCTLIV